MPFSPPPSLSLYTNLEVKENGRYNARHDDRHRRGKPLQYVVRVLDDEGDEEAATGGKEDDDDDGELIPFEQRKRKRVRSECVCE